MLKFLNVLTFTLFVFFTSVTSNATALGAFLNFAQNPEERPITNPDLEEEIILKGIPEIFIDVLLHQAANFF